MSGYLRKIPKRTESEPKSSRTMLANNSGEFFRNAFPTLSIIIDKLESTKKDNVRDKAQQNISRERFIRRSDTIANNLTNLTIEQKETVTLLNELLDAVRGLKSVRNDRSRSGGGISSLGSNLVADIAGVAIREALLSGGSSQQNEQASELQTRQETTGESSPRISAGGATPRISGRSRENPTATATQEEPPTADQQLASITIGLAQLVRSAAEQELTDFRERVGPSSTRQNSDGGSEEYYENTEHNEQFRRLQNRANETKQQEERFRSQFGVSPQTSSRLNFAPGVDPRINDSIAQKVERISDTAPDMVITSGYRDSQRNSAAGGARNSAHLRGNAVDIQFRGNEQDTVKVIEAASAAGIGGIGVYRPGWLHLDTESKRVWGPDYTDRSIPEWARPSLQAHAGGQQRPNQESAQRIEAEPSAPSLVRPSTAATPTVPTPTSGAAVIGASQVNAVAERTPAPPTIVTSGSTSSGQASAGLVTPGTFSSPTEPGNVEPADSAERYARLFNMAA